MDAIDKEIEASGKAVELVSYLIGKSPCCKITGENGWVRLHAFN